MRLAPLSRAIFSISAQAMSHKLSKPLSNLSTLSIGAMTLGSLISYQSAMAADVVNVTTTVPVTEEVKIEAIEVNASADASKSGLPAAYQGGQVATGSRVGILGNKSIMQTPFSTTAYTNDYLKDQQTSTVGDALKTDSTVRVARGFGNFQEVYVMRGFTTSSDQTMYNGLFGILPRQQIPTQLFERVEVLRGATAMANGATPGGGNIGGTVSLLPKRAGNTPLNEVTLGYGAGNRATGAVDIARRFGDNNEFGVRLNAVTSGNNTPVDDEKAKLSTAALGMDYRKNNVRLSADLGVQDNKLDRPRPSVTLGSAVTAVPKAPDLTKNWAQPWTFSNEKDVFGTLRGEYDFNPNLTAYAAYGFRNTKESNATANLTVTQNDGTGTIYRFDNERKNTINTGEIGLKGKANTGTVSHSWVVSANTFDNTEKGAYLYDFANSPSSLYRPTIYPTYPFTSLFKKGNMSDPQRTEKTQLHSVAVADTLGFMQDKVQLTLGVRHQTLKDTGYDADTQAITSQYNQSKNTPMAALVYRLQPNVSLYANYSEGLAQGDRSYAQTVTNYGVPLAPAVSKQSEIGAKFDNGTLGGGLALFSIKQPRAFLRNNGNNTTTYLYQGENQHKGVELNIFGSPTYNTRLIGGMTFIDAKQKDTGDSTSTDKRVIGVPKFQGNVGAEWDVSKVDGLTLTGNVLHTGDRYADASNTQKVDAATTLNLGVRYKTKMNATPVTLRGEVENVTNKNYWASVGGYPGYGYLNAGQPRTVKLSATFDF